MAKKFGYARVSTADQSLSIQEAKLAAAGCAAVFAEKASGATAARPELERALAVLGEGDTLIVTRLDRLGRSSRDLQNLIAAIHAKGASLQATEQAIDTRGASGKLFVDVLAAVAEFETTLRKERQSEGITAAKANGKYQGRPPKIDSDAIRKAHGAGESPTAIAKRLSVSRMSVYRALETTNAN